MEIFIGRINLCSNTHINKTNFSTNYLYIFKHCQPNLPLPLAFANFAFWTQITHLYLYIFYTFCSSSALFLMSSSVNTFSMSPAMITRSLPKHFKTNFTLIDCLSMFTFPPNTGDSLSHEVEEVLLQCLVNYTNWNCFEIFKASIPCFPLDPPYCSPGSWPERTGLALSSSACWPSSCLTLAFSWGETTHCYGLPLGIMQATIHSWPTICLTVSFTGSQPCQHRLQLTVVHFSCQAIKF